VADGVNPDLTGFEGIELDRLLTGFKPPRDADEAPPLPESEPESEPGATYELGAHLLHCADATDKSGLSRFVAGETVQVLWTDPPYGVEYVGKTRSALTLKNDSAANLPGLLEQAFAAANSVLAPGGRFYVCAPAGPQGTTFRLAIEKTGWRFHQSLVWVKHAPVLGHSDYLYQHEDVLYGWKPGPGRPGRGRHRGSRWYGDNSQRSVFNIARPARSELHPTMKPVELIAAMLTNSSRRGDTVLDLFGGSGSTLIACEQLGRRCLMVEVDPRYCDVIRRRYQEFVDGR
jgi:DNA modification methylase